MAELSFQTARPGHNESHAKQRDEDEQDDDPVHAAVVGRGPGDLKGERMRDRALKALRDLDEHGLR